MYFLYYKNINDNEFFSNEMSETCSLIFKFGLYMFYKYSLDIRLSRLANLFYDTALRITCKAEISSLLIQQTCQFSLCAFKHNGDVIVMYVDPGCTVISNVVIFTSKRLCFCDVLVVKPLHQLQMPLIIMLV